MVQKKKAKKAPKKPYSKPEVKPMPSGAEIEQQALKAAATAGPPPVSVREDQERRLAACQQEVNAILDKYRCVISPVIAPQVKLFGEQNEGVVTAQIVWGVHP